MSASVQFNVDQALAKLGELVSKHGPDAVDLAAEVVQVNAIGNLIRGGAFAVVAAGATFFTAKLWLWTISEDGDDSAVAAAIPASAATTFLWVAALIPALNVWNWTALVNPKLALAHEVLVKLTGL